MPVELKLHNVYALPDGYELVARRGVCGEYALHDPQKGVAAPPVYIVSRSGQLLSWHQRTTLAAADLIDTGKAWLPEIERLVIL